MDKEKILNPITGRYILKSGNTYKEILKKTKQPEESKKFNFEELPDDIKNIISKKIKENSYAVWKDDKSKIMSFKTNKKGYLKILSRFKPDENLTLATHNKIEKFMKKVEMERQELYEVEYTTFTREEKAFLMSVFFINITNPFDIRANITPFQNIMAIKIPTIDFFLVVPRIVHLDLDKVVLPQISGYKWESIADGRVIKKKIRNGKVTSNNEFYKNITSLYGNIEGSKGVQPSYDYIYILKYKYDIDYTKTQSYKDFKNKFNLSIRNDDILYFKDDKKNYEKI
tara:strand:- start:403 stop:1257 length:855 start_codon:yes stop_codon:yes gene_type:complete